MEAVVEPFLPIDIIRGLRAPTAFFPSPHKTPIPGLRLHNAALWGGGSNLEGIVPVVKGVFCQEMPSPERIHVVLLVGDKQVVAMEYSVIVPIAHACRRESCYRRGPCSRSNYP